MADERKPVSASSWLAKVCAEIYQHRPTLPLADVMGYRPTDADIEKAFSMSVAL